MNTRKMLQMVLALTIPLFICSTSSIYTFPKLQAASLTQIPMVKIKGVSEVTSASAPSVAISNAYLKSQTSVSGRFIVGTTGGDPNTPNDDNKRVLYGYPNDVGSSFSTLRVINDSTINDYRLGGTDWDNTGIAPIAQPSSNGTTITTIWAKDGIRVEERLFFAQNLDTARMDTTAIEYTIKNDNSTKRSIGLRIMLDTMIGDNDGAPFFILGAGQLTQEFEFLGSNIPEYWIAYESPNFDPNSLKGRGQLTNNGATAPDRLVVAHWGGYKCNNVPGLFESTWDYTPNRNFAMTCDSAVALYYNPVTLDAGQARTIRTYYGIAKAGDVAQLELTGLEVTQGIQNLENTVVLIEDKPTFVRAHVRSTAGRINGVTAVLIGKRNGNELPGSPLQPQNPGNDVDVLENPNRVYLNSSFYFELPKSWRNGKVEFEFRGVNRTIVCKEHANTDEDCKAEVTFKKSPALDVLIAGAIWKQSNGVKHVPTFEDIEALAREIEAMFPIPYLKKIHPYNFELILNDYVQDPGTLNLRLAEQRVLDGCVNVSTLGCQRIYVGIIVDPPDNTKILGMGGLPFSIASGFWIRADQKFKNVKGEDWHAIIPHEVGHALGPIVGFRPHTPFCTAVGVPGWNYPYPNGYISSVESGDDAFYGFNIFSKLIFGPKTGDLMSYCRPMWTSDWTYNGLYDEITSRFGSANSASVVANAISSPALLVSGRITPALNIGKIESIYAFNSTSIIPTATSGTYALVLEDNSGIPLVTYPFDPVPDSHCPPYCSPDEQVSTFALAIPDISQATRIRLLHNGQILASRAASTNAPVISVVSPNGGETLSGVTATLSWSANDADGDPLKYAAQYSADGGTTWQTLIANWPSMTYVLDLNAIAGTNQGLVRILASDGFNTSQDQSNATFNVDRHSPQVSIRTPENNRIYVGNQMIILEGGAYDNEDGELGDTALSWTSNLNGTLGSGRSLAVGASTLTVGTHIISLTAQDSDGGAKITTVTVQVYRERPTLPIYLAIAPTSLNFVDMEGNEQTDGQMISINNDGDGTMSWVATTDQDWILLSSLAGTAPTDIIVAADLSGRAPGEYTGNIMITASASNSPQNIPVTLNINASIVSGDCNNDRVITASDVTALALEFFDGDDNGNPLATAGGSYAGSPACDANEDNRIGASDVTCIARLFFNGPGACRAGVTTAAATNPSLTLPNQLPAVAGGQVTVPITLNSHDTAVGSLLFALDYDESWLHFDPADNDGNGIPDAVTFNLPAEFVTTVTFDPGAAGGELDFTIANFAATPVALPDGALATVTLTTGQPPVATTAAIGFAQTPAASFGHLAGTELSGTTADGSVVIGVQPPNPLPNHTIYLPLISERQ